jgi:hypothetical protein
MPPHDDSHAESIKSAVFFMKAPYNLRCRLAKLLTSARWEIEAKIAATAHAPCSFEENPRSLNETLTI